MRGTSLESKCTPANDYEQGIDFFVHDGYQTRINGERETKRGTSNPTYLYYTLGKLEILKLREDYKKMPEATLRCRSFTTGSCSRDAAIKIVRKALLGNDSPCYRKWGGRHRPRRTPGPAPRMHGIEGRRGRRPRPGERPTSASQLNRSAEAFQIFLGHRLQRYPAAPGTQSSGNHVRIESFLPQ